MFHDLLLWSFLFSGISLIFVLFLIGIFYSSSTTKIQYLKTIWELCTLQHTFMDKKVFQKYCHLHLKTHYFACTLGFSLSTGRKWATPFSTKVSSFLATLPWETRTWKDQGSKQLEHWLFQEWLGEVQNSFWLQKIKFILQL